MGFISLWNMTPKMYGNLGVVSTVNLAQQNYNRSQRGNGTFTLGEVHEILTFSAGWALTPHCEPEGRGNLTAARTIAGMSINQERPHLCDPP